MQTKHWGLLAGILSSLGLIIASLPDWEHAMRPAFIGGAMGAVATVIGALYSERPTARKTPEIEQ